MNVRSMQHSRDISSLPNVQPGLHLLRGEDIAELAHIFRRSSGMHGTAQGITQSLDRLGPQRSRNPAIIQGGPSDWFGRGHGVRQPELAETHLSQAEVMHGIRHGLIALETK